MSMRYRAMHCDVVPLDVDHPQYFQVKKSIQETQVRTLCAKYVTLSDNFFFKKANSYIRVHNIYSIRREVEHQKFTNNLSNKKLLFHGSRYAIWPKIFSPSDLRIDL